MVKLAYVNDGTSVYDLLFLKRLTKENTVYFLTFNNDPRFVSSETIVKKMLWSVSADSKTEGVYMYALCLLRALLLRVHLNCIKPHLVLGCMATKYGFYSALSGFKPFILIVWGSDILIAPKRFFLFRFMAKFTLKKADAVIVDSEVQKDVAIQLGCDPQKILKFPWFDLDDVRVETCRNRIREELGWRKNPIIICLRRHDSIWGVQYLIEAIPQVIRVLPESRFLILGKGQLSDRFKHRVKELKMQKFVKFLGQVSRKDVIAYLNAADVYVSTSLSDGTSASLLEAMALGVAPIVTNISGNTEWIRNGWSGYLVPVKDSQRLAERIVLLVKNKELRQKISQNALKTVKTSVDWRKNSKALGDLISKLITERSIEEGK